MGDDLARKLLATTDAQVWAREFTRLFGDTHAVDESLMLTWFANAIETGRTAGDARIRDLEAENHRLRAELEAQRPLLERMGHVVGEVEP